MSNLPTPASPSSAPAARTSGGSPLAQVTEANLARALAEVREFAANTPVPRRRFRWARPATRSNSLTPISQGYPRGRRVAMAGAVAAFGAASLTVSAASADARVLPVTTVVAHPGPVTTPAGNVRCKGKGDYHFTAHVPTTGTDSQGHHHAALWVQYPRTGQADLVGFAKSTTRTVTVIGCLTPARIPGFNGTAIVIAEDITDGFTRPFRVVVKAAR